MSIDLVKAVIEARNQARAARGSIPASGRWSPPSAMVPNTTVGDVNRMTVVFEDLIDKVKDSWPFTLTWEVRGRVADAMNKWRASQPNRKGVFLNEAEIYPYNDEYWGTMYQAMLMASSAGAVPGEWEYFKEAVKEAIGELPGRLIPVVVYAILGYLVFDAITRRS